MLNVRAVTQKDYTNLSVIVVSAFGQSNELNLVKALRASGHVAIELLAESQHGIEGHLCVSWMDSPSNWLTLGPVCVRTESQGTGIGAELIRYGLDAARQMKADAVLVVGDPTYYKRFGFVFDGPAKLVTPYPKQYTGLFPIKPSIAAADAVLAYPQPFAEV